MGTTALVVVWHSRCLGSNIIVFSALLVQQRISMILCLIVRHIVPSGTDSQTYFGAQRWLAPTLSSFFTLHDPKVIARFSRECFEHTNTLMAAQTGHNLESTVECVSCELYVFISAVEQLVFCLTSPNCWSNGHGWLQDIT